MRGGCPRLHARLLEDAGRPGVRGVRDGDYLVETELTEAAELAKRVADSVKEIGTLAHQVSGAEVAGRLLIGQQREHHVAGGLHPGLGRA